MTSAPISFAWSVRGNEAFTFRNTVQLQLSSPWYLSKNSTSDVFKRLLENINLFIRLIRVQAVALPHNCRLYVQQNNPLTKPSTLIRWLSSELVSLLKPIVNGNCRASERNYRVHRHVPSMSSVSMKPTFSSQAIRCRLAWRRRQRKRIQSALDRLQSKRN